MVEVKWWIPREIFSDYILIVAGKGGNFGASKWNVFNSTPNPIVSYAPPMNTSYGDALGEIGGYPSPNMAPCYGTSVDYGPAIIGGVYGNTTFVNNIPAQEAVME